MDIGEKLSKLPTEAGVYLMKDARHEVIYVGKAKNLRARVRSYFQDTDDGRPFTKHLVKRTEDVDFVVTATEKEALILENNLIKQFHPRYNIVFRDDKTYASIKVDLNEPWPVPRIVRQREKKPGVLYFGPYASAHAARATLKQIHATFPLRKCSRRPSAMPPRPCIQHEMGRCLGPCSGKVTEAQYQEIVDQAILVLKGAHEDLLEELRQRMQAASAALDFEKAALLRDRIQDVEQTLEKQRITSSAFEDRDVFGFYAEGSEVEVQAMFIRAGKLEELATYRLGAKLNTADEVFRSFLNQFYSRMRFIPRSVLVPIETEDAVALSEWLTEMRGHKVKVHRPLRGEKRRLVEMAQTNARNSFVARKSAAERQDTLAESLREKLRLARAPRRIECFDISNMRGLLAVGAMVTFKDGQPEKSRYRRFRIKTVRQSDDFAMMYEVLSRHYANAAAENDLPELAIIDGGKGQLSVAQRVLNELNIADVEVVGLAKARAGRGTQERFFRPGEREPIVLEQNSAELLLLTRIRDEAHRFAISYHRKLRHKSAVPSPLDSIPGVGPARKVALLRYFGSIGNIRKASVRELMNVRSVSETLARQIHQWLHPGQTAAPPALRPSLRKRKMRDEGSGMRDQG